MVKKKKVTDEKSEYKEKKTLTITLSSELYQLLLKKTGKGNIGNYVREAVEMKLKEEEMVLTRAYKLLEESPEYQEQTTLFQEIWEDKNYQETILKNEKKSPQQLKKERKKNG